jgi:hypothetical protein
MHERFKLILIELGGYIINIERITYVRSDKDKVQIFFGGTPDESVILQGQDAKRFTELLHQFSPVVS